jgi:hypothetical protein
MGYGECKICGVKNDPSYEKFCKKHNSGRWCVSCKKESSYGLGEGCICDACAVKMMNQNKNKTDKFFESKIGKITGWIIAALVIYFLGSYILDKIFNYTPKSSTTCQNLIDRGASEESIEQCLKADQWEDELGAEPYLK